MARSTSKSGPEWPTIEDQLRAAHVQPGSKLEELIRENQDFSLLRPEELDDGLRIPIWLASIPKAYPDSTPIPGDPTGGYPLALRDLYEWMIEHQDLPETG